MGGEMLTLTFAITTRDDDQWLPEHRALAHNDPNTDSSGDWIIARLGAVMRDAGNRFVAQHPDLFVTSEPPGSSALQG